MKSFECATSLIALLVILPACSLVRIAPVHLGRIVQMERYCIEFTLQNRTEEDQYFGDILGLGDVDESFGNAGHEARAQQTALESIREDLHGKPGDGRLLSPATTIDGYVVFMISLVGDDDFEVEGFGYYRILVDNKAYLGKAPPRNCASVESREAGRSLEVLGTSNFVILPVAQRVSNVTLQADPALDITVRHNLIAETEKPQFVGRTYNTDTQTFSVKIDATPGGDVFRIKYDGDHAVLASNRYRIGKLVFLDPEHRRQKLFDRRARRFLSDDYPEKWK